MADTLCKKHLQKLRALIYRLEPGVGSGGYATASGVGHHVIGGVVARPGKTIPGLFEHEKIAEKQALKQGGIYPPMTSNAGSIS
jgi:hypothetical protein